jgi:hypothetical protein
MCPSSSFRDQSEDHHHLDPDGLGRAIPPGEVPWLLNIGS